MSTNRESLEPTTRDLVLTHLQKVQPTRILEVGCGDGVVTRYLSATFPDAYVLGIDTDESCILKARPDGDGGAHFQTQRLHTLRRQMSACCDEVFDGERRRKVLFDVVLFLTPPGLCRKPLIRAVRALGRGIANAADILAPGGLLIIVRATQQGLAEKESRLPGKTYTGLLTHFGLRRKKLPKPDADSIIVAELVE